MAGSIWSWSLTADNNQTADGDINWQENQLPDTVNNSARVMMKREAEYLADIAGSLTTAGSSNAYTLTANSAFTALTTGLRVSASASFSNTGAATLNANSLGAKAIRKQGVSADVALVTGDIISGQVYHFVYSTAANSAAGGWILQNPGFPEYSGVSVSSLTVSGTITGSGMALTSTDAGATVGPTIDLYRDSASPAAADVLGGVQFNGEDSAGNKTEYARINAIIDDPTNGSEDGNVTIQAMSAGTLSNALTVYSGLTRVNGGGTTPGIDTDGTDNEFILRSSSTPGTGGSVHLFGSTHASAANDVWIVSGATTVYQYDSSSSAQYVATDIRFAQNTTTAPGNGNNTAGVGISTTGFLCASSTGGMLVNVTTDPGTLAFLNIAGTQQGSIAGSGATISYNAFFGSHWSQLADGSKPDILRGTICESIDQMCEWPGEGPEERLPRFKISDTPGSKKVYGVFAWWDDGWEATNDAHIGAIGAYVIRIQAGETIQIGDFIESAGNGCGRVQADDILRSSTVAKITSATVIETYRDGSYLVPCTLHCG